MLAGWRITEVDMEDGITVITLQLTMMTTITGLLEGLVRAGKIAESVIMNMNIGTTVTIRIMIVEGVVEVGERVVIGGGEIRVNAKEVF
jgi:hypothetical protein